MSKLITYTGNNKDVCDWVEKVTGVDPHVVQRVVIDINLGNVIKIFIETIASTKMLEVDFPQPTDTTNIKFVDVE